MELKKNVKHGHLPFFQQDIHNLYVKMRKMHAVNDAMDLLQFCKVSKKMNYKFQYAFTIDEDKMLEYIFWSHPHSFDWYQKYGNVVVFYTTYKINAYNMSFGIFVCINNHRKIILFGCALLQNETTSVFRCLMNVLYLSYNFVQLFFHFI